MLIAAAYRILNIKVIKLQGSMTKPGAIGEAMVFRVGTFALYVSRVRGIDKAYHCTCTDTFVLVLYYYAAF